MLAKQTENLSSSERRMKTKSSSIRHSMKLARLILCLQCSQAHKIVAIIPPRRRIHKFFINFFTMMRRRVRSIESLWTSTTSSSESSLTSWISFNGCFGQDLINFGPQTTRDHPRFQNFYCSSLSRVPRMRHRWFPICTFQSRSHICEAFTCHKDPQTRG